MPCDERQVVWALTDALSPQPVGSPPVVVLEHRSRRRSDLWFLAREGERVARWVVKRPCTESRQGDLTAPLSSEAQMAALTLLAGHFAATAPSLRAPAPVALLAEIDAFAMEFVSGRHVAQLIHPSALVRPEPLLSGVAEAAGVLRVLHRLSPGDGLGDDVRDHPGDGHGDDVGDDLGDDQGGVVLHGDFAPENVLLAGPDVYCLDPELTRRGPAEADLVRFLTMLYDAPMFVLGATVPAVQRLRRRAATAFLTAYLGDRPAHADVRPALTESLAARWTTRTDDVRTRQPRLAGARRRLLDTYFSMLLGEVSRSSVAHARS